MFQCRNSGKVKLLGSKTIGIQCKFYAWSSALSNINSTSLTDLTMCQSPPLCIRLWESAPHCGQTDTSGIINYFNFEIFFSWMSVQHLGKRLDLTVYIWRRCLQSFSSSVCKRGLCSPVQIKYTKHWLHFLCLTT